MTTRTRTFACLLTTLVAGCSLLFNGNDLKGRNGDGGAGSGGGDDMSAGGGGGAGGGGTGGGGGTAQCTPRATPKFTVTHPSVAASSPLYIDIGDINKDGLPDLVTANYNSNTFSVLLGDGNGSFMLAATTPVATCGNPLDIIARDVTGDGLDDVIVTCWDGSSASAVNVHVNQTSNGTVAFAAPKPVTLPAASKYYFPVVGKFDTSGHTALALVGNNAATLYAGDGAGGFTKGTTLPAGSGAQSAAVADLNGDMLDEIVVFNYDDSDLTMMLSSTVTAGYVPVRLAYDSTDMSPGGQIDFGSTPLLIDYDGDSLLDIVIARGTSVPGAILFFKNTGAATAPTFPIHPTATANVGDIPLTVAMADFTCDGKLDLAVNSNGCEVQQGCSNGSSEPQAFWLLPGLGTGFDTMQTTSTLDQYCDNLVVADFNRDGYPEIACGSGSSGINLLINSP